MERPLLEDIRDRLDEFTATEKKAAHALLANYPMQGLGTVAQFAEAAGVSSPTILRFVGRLGFPGFAEFQRKLRGELESQLNSPLARSANMEDDPVGDPHVSQLPKSPRTPQIHVSQGCVGPPAGPREM